MTDEHFDTLHIVLLKICLEVRRIADTLDRAYPEPRPIVPSERRDDAVTRVTPEMRRQWEQEEQDHARHAERIAAERLR